MLFYCMERLIFQGLQRIIYLRSLSKKGSVYNEFPGQWLGKPLREIEEAARNGDPAAKKAKKLLTQTSHIKNILHTLKTLTLCQ